MDVHYFLNKRLEFIRSFHKTAAQPFIEIKRKIEESESPYIPPYSEDGEPPFLSEWLEAEESIQVLGYMCVSMLSASLKLYFQTWKDELGFSIDDELRKVFKKEGWLHGYSSYFLKHYGIKFPNIGVNLLLLEEIALARNMAQHPEYISTNIPFFSDKDIQKLGIPTFTSEVDRRMSRLGEGKNDGGLFPVSLHVNSEQLEFAIQEVGKLNDWLNSEIYTRVYKRKPVSEKIGRAHV